MAVILLGSDPNLSRGGIAAVLPSYVSLLNHTGVAHRLIATHSNDQISGKFRHFIPSLLALISTIREYRAKKLTPIVHAHVGRWPSLIRKRLLLGVAKAAGARTILHIHSSEVENYLNEPVQRRILTSFFRGVDLILTLGPYWADLVTARTGIPTEILPNPLSPELEMQARMPVAERSPSHEVRLLSIGRLIPGKGFDFLVEVLAKLPASMRLTLAGEGELLKPLKARTYALHCESRVAFPGWVTGTEKEQLFRQADAFCLFTWRDALSTAVIEAMAHGLPIIASDYGPTRDMVPPRAGLLISKSASADDAASAISKLSPAQRHWMGVAAKQWVLDTYNAERVARDWLALLHRLAPGDEGGPPVV